MSRKNVVKILSAVTVAGAMTLSSSAIAAGETNQGNFDSATLVPTASGNKPLVVKQTTAASSATTMATTSAVPPEARLSAHVVGWLPIPLANFPSFLAKTPKGVRYANNAWQVYNPFVGVFCIWPAETTGIYINQVFPTATIDWSWSWGNALFVYYRSTLPATFFPFPNQQVTPTPCQRFATNPVGINPPGLGLGANPFIEIDTYQMTGAATAALWNRVAFNVVVQ